MRGSRFEVFKTSNPELRTHGSACLACLAFHAPRLVFGGSLLLGEGELGKLSLVEALLYQRVDVEHLFDPQDVFESGFRAGVGRGEE